MITSPNLFKFFLLIHYPIGSYFRTIPYSSLDLIIKMSLIKCIECGNDVSEYAEACPKCGCPISVIKNKIIEKEHEENNPISNERCPICKAGLPHIITDNITTSITPIVFLFSKKSSFSMSQNR